MYYFVKVPKLPKEFSHQDGAVKLVEYLVQEGDKIPKGHPIAIIENWWAHFTVLSIGPGYVEKTFFHPQTTVKIGDPFMIITCEGEDAPALSSCCEIVLLKVIRKKI